MPQTVSHSHGAGRRDDGEGLDTQTSPGSIS
jgi:hypothetical protein